MRINKYIIAPILFLIFNSCVERYFIEDHQSITPHIVIEGSITDGCDTPEIIISQSSSTEKLEFIPVSGCTVQVIDKENNVYNFIEDLINSGHYSASIDAEHLYIGNKYKLLVQTPNLEMYESDFEEMLPCPPIDSIYYEIIEIPTPNPDIDIKGLQFYIDFKGSEYFGNYYRWMLDETYEYHSTWPKKDFIDMNNRVISGLIDFSTFICYKTYTIDDVLLLSTKPLTENVFKRGKLLFVDNLTQRLKYNYSLLIKQQSLSEAAFNYWTKLKKNDKESTGLFTKQPSQTAGNIRNVNDSTEVVLGFFSVSSETNKRIVLSDYQEMSFDIQYCTPFLKDKTWPFDPRPLYIFNAEIGENVFWPAWAPSDCFDCTLHGGVLEKPSFFEMN